MQSTTKSFGTCFVLGLVATTLLFVPSVVLADDPTSGEFDGNLSVRVSGDTTESTGTLSITGSNATTVPDSSIQDLDVSMPPRFEPIDATVAPDPVAIDESVEITIEVRNHGQGGTDRIVVSANTTKIESWVQHLGPGGSVTLRTTTEFETAGIYAIEVNDREMTTVTVTEASDGDGETVETQDEPIETTSTPTTETPRGSTQTTDDKMPSTAFYPGVIGFLLAFMLFGIAIFSRRRSE